MGNTAIQPPQPALCLQAGVEEDQRGLRAMQRYVMPGVFVGVLALGLPLNLLSLWVFSRRLPGRRWRRSTVLLFSLTLADTSWLLALPFLVLFHLDGLAWTLGQPLCKAVRLLYHNYFYLSIVLVACVSVDRYVAIVHPLRSLALLGARGTATLCVVVWAATLLSSVPVAGMSVTQRCPGTNRTVCTLYMMMQDTRESLPYSLFSSLSGFLLPLASISYCYCRCVAALRRRGSLLGPRPPHPDRMRRLACVLTAVLVLFTALYLPYHLVRNAMILMRALYPLEERAWGDADLAFCVEMCVCSLNTVINPVFTCCVGKQVRREFQSLMAFLCLRCDPDCVAPPTPKRRGGGGGGRHGVNTVTLELFTGSPDSENTRVDPRPARVGVVL